MGTQAQVDIEQAIGLSKYDALFINDFGSLPAVSTFKQLLALQIKNADKAGINLLKESLREVRGLAIEIAR